MARLVLFFSLNFIIIFMAAAGIKFLSLLVDWAKNLPPEPVTFLMLLITACHWALSLTLFSSLILALNYAARRNYPALITIPCVMILSILLCFGISTALVQWKAVPPSLTSGIPMGSDGLILSNSISKNETAVILLRGTADPLGPKVIAIPGQPLLYQKSTSFNYSLPPVPFEDDTPWFLKSLSIDIRLNAEKFQEKFAQGLFPYLFYVVPLIFLLCSLGYAIRFSVWPLANLFIAALAFRGLLALITFLNTPEMQEITDSFFNNRIPVSLALPLLFIALGVLIYLYSFLVFIVKRRTDDGY